MPCLRCKCVYLMWVQDPSHAAFKEKMKEFMASFDKNSDGRIEMLEVRTGPPDSPFVRDLSHAAALTCVFVLQLAQLLPTEENFLLCFREFVGSSSEFMAVSLSLHWGFFFPIVSS